MQVNHLSSAEEIPMLAYKAEWTCKLIGVIYDVYFDWYWFALKQR